MITQSAKFSIPVLKSLLSAYNNGTNYIGVEQADLLTYPLASGITSDPKAAITNLSGPFTIPAKFFGVHTNNPASIAALAAAGAKTFRTRDCGITWAELMPLGGTTTFTAGSTNTANKTAHGMSASTHGVFFNNTGGSLPSGITANTLYYLVNVATDTYQISATPGGAAISLGTTGSGTTTAYGCVLSKINPLTGAGTFDALINAASTAGMDILYDCTLVPTWISKDGTTHNIPTSQTQILHFLSFLHAYYGNKVAYFEVWNEPNTAGYFNGTMTGAGNDLYTYAGWIFDAIAYFTYPWKVVSPSWNISIGASAMGTWLGTDGGKNKIDIVACHTYRGNTYLGYDNAAVDAYIAQATANAPGKEVWISEVGESLPTEAILRRAHFYAAAKGIKRMFWYDYDMSVGSSTPGFDMRITSYPGLDAAYKTMLATAGSACDYINQCIDGKIGVSVAGVAKIF